MNKWLKKIEEIVDWLIPWMLLLLLAIIVVEIFFEHTAEIYHTQILIADYVVITVFVIDLAYKYNKARKIPLFLKKYWLDIIAVFPIFLILRLFQELGLILEIGQRTQQILHEGLEIEKEGARIVREIEAGAKTARASRFARFLRPIARLPRFAKALGYFRPTKKSQQKVKKNRKKRR